MRKTNDGQLSKGGNKAMDMVSVNIVNWNGMCFLKDCIESIKMQTYKNIEINIADNNSVDGSVDFLTNTYHEIKLIRNRRNEGFSKAHNRLIDVSGGKYIMPLNFDIILEPSFVEEMVRAMEFTPDTGIVSGKLFIIDSGKKTPIIDSTGITMRYMFPADRGQFERDCGNYDKKEFVFGASGAAPLLKKEMLEEIKYDGEYFDEDFYIYVEDVDLCWRAQLYGWKAVYTPSAIAFHYRGATRKDDVVLKRDYLIIGIRNRYWAIIKNTFLSSIITNLFSILYREIGFYINALRAGHYFVLQIPFKTIPGLPAVLRKRRVIKKGRKVTTEYMDSFFVGDYKGR